ncbi:MAG: ester cyclase [Dehalococcoidia bacterium]
MMSEQDLVKAARANIEAANARDWGKFKETLAGDVVYDEVGTGRKTKGADAWVEAYKGWIEAFPDVVGKVSAVHAAGNTATVELTWEGTQTGPLVSPAGTIPASGKRQTTRASIVMTFDGEAIKEAHHYFDMVSLLTQIGAMPGA